MVDADRPVAESFDLYLRDVGKGRGGEGGTYRRNVERELDRFLSWATGDADGAGGVVDGDLQFADLSPSVFREYARHLRGLDVKQNTVKTYYRMVSSWVGWCVEEGYLEGHYAQRAAAKRPLPDDDGRRPGDQQSWTADQRHAITEYVDDRAREAVEALADAPGDPGDLDRQRARYDALVAARDRALVCLLAYTGVRVGELLRLPEDPRRRGVRWADVSLADNSMTLLRKKQDWDHASVPEPIVPAVRAYRRLLDPPSDRWPVFPTFDYRTLAGTVTEGLADAGLRPDEIESRREAYARDLLLALDEDLRPPSLTADGARSLLRRLTDRADLAVEGRHDYLAPHGGRRGMGEVLVRAFGYTAAARYLDNSESMVRQHYSHIEAGELGDVAADALDAVEGGVLAGGTDDPAGQSPDEGATDAADAGGVDDALPERFRH